MSLGPDSDTTLTRGVALWFNVPDAAVQVNPEAKRFRWQKALDQNKSSMFDKLDKFIMYRPHDEAAFKLTTDILEHRLSVLKAENLRDKSKRMKELQALNKEKRIIMAKTELLLRYWASWACPFLDSRNQVDEETLIPEVEREFIVSNQGECLLGKELEKVWSSFVKNIKKVAANDTENYLPAYPGRKCSMFDGLANGIPLSPFG